MVTITILSTKTIISILLHPNCYSQADNMMKSTLPALMTRCMQPVHDSKHVISAVQTNLIHSSLGGKKKGNSELHRLHRTMWENVVHLVPQCSFVIKVIFFLHSTNPQIKHRGSCQEIFYFSLLKSINVFLLSLINLFPVTVIKRWVIDPVF